MTEGAPPNCVRFLASIDDAGDVLVLAGSSITFGGSTREPADVPLRADGATVRAHASLTESFHGGLSWLLSIDHGGSPPTVDGQPLGDLSRPIVLVDGMEVAFGRGASFRVCRSDPSSAALMLELQRGTEVAGARRVLLMTCGPAGRVRVGARRKCHVTVAGLEDEVEIVVEAATERDPARVLVRCEGGARRAALLSDHADPTTTSITLDLPLTRRVDLVLGAAPKRLPPFGIALRPPGP